MEGSFWSGEIPTVRQSRLFHSTAVLASDFMAKENPAPLGTGFFAYKFGRSLLRCGFVHFQDVVPVDQAVDEGFEILRTGVAVVDVVGVFPHVDAEDRRGAVNQRVLAVRGLGD